MKKFLLLPLVLASAMFVGCPIQLPPIVIPTPIPSATPTATPLPTPVPTPSPVPTPTTSPTARCSFPQGVPQEDFKEVTNPGQFSKVMDATIKELTTCAGETDCTWGPLDPQIYIKQLVVRLQEKGYCAGQHVDGDTDQISIALSCGANVVWENYQPVNFGGVQHKARFAPANVKSGWQVPVSCTGVPPVTIPTPVPTPIPQPIPTPVVSGCTAPPVNKYVVDCRPKAGPFNDFCSATPKVHDSVYCAPNVDCPYQGGEGSPQRIALEKACASPVVWVGGIVREDNFLSADVPKGNTVTITGPGGATGKAVAQ